MASGEVPSRAIPDFSRALFSLKKNNYCLQSTRFCTWLTEFGENFAGQFGTIFAKSKYTDNKTSSAD